MRTGMLQQKLEYETSWHYDLGVYHRIGDNFDTRFVVYYSDVSDYVALDRPSAYNPTAYAYNIDSVGFYGFECEFDARFDKLNIFGNYTFIDNHVTDTGLPITFWVDMSAKHKANVGIRYSFRKDLMFTSDVRYVGTRKSEGGFDIDSYLVTDIGLEYSFLSNRARVQIYVNNLFGERYQEVYGYPMPKQTFGTSLKYTF